MRILVLFLFYENLFYIIIYYKHDKQKGGTFMRTSKKLYPENLMTAIFDFDGIDQMTFDQHNNEIYERRLRYIIDAAFDDQSKKIIECRFKKQWTLQATADSLGLTRERVRQLEEKAIREFHRPLYSQILRYGQLKAELDESVSQTITIDDMHLSVRIYNALKRAGYNTLDDIKKLTYDDLKALHLTDKNIKDLTDILLQQYGVVLEGK